MTEAAENWWAAQRQVCQRFQSRFVPVGEDARIGVALATMNQRPLHGLRHPRHGNMEGWYIWGGEYSVAPDFFDVLHARHLPPDFPEIMKFLALEPGFRFLADGEYLDVWFDESILKI